MKTNTDRIIAIRQILIIAKIKGEWLRFPNRFESSPNIGGMVGLAIARCPCHYSRNRKKRDLFVRRPIQFRRASAASPISDL